jgi:hypothetical protein
MIYKIDNNLNYKRVRDTRNVFKISITLNVILVLTLIYSFSYPEQILTSIVIKDTVLIEVPNDIELTDSTITEELIKLKCVLPNVALAQMKIETGHFKSDICKENKNIAGIRTSTSEFVKRDLKGNPLKNRGHNVYNTYKDCLKDYVRIQNRYLKNIDGRYAESKTYIEHIKKVK